MAVSEETKQEVPAPAEVFVVKTNFIGKLRGIISSSSPKKLIGFAAIGVLIIVLPLTVIMSQKQQETRQRASEASRIEIIGPNVANGVATSRNVKLKLTYVPVAAPPTEAPAATVEPTTVSTTPTGDVTPTVSPSEAPPTATLVPPTSVPPTGTPVPPTAIPATPTIIPRTCGSPITACQADVDRNGVVTILDWSLMASSTCLNKPKPDSGPCSLGDFNGNGIIDRQDVACVQEQFEQYCPSNRPTTSGVQGAATAQEASTTISFRVSNDQNTLEQAQVQSFVPEELAALTKEIDWQLTEGNGDKTVFAQFKFGDAAWESVLFSSVILNETTSVVKSFEQAAKFYGTGEHAISDMQNSTTPDVTTDFTIETYVKVDSYDKNPLYYNGILARRGKATGPYEPTNFAFYLSEEYEFDSYIEVYKNTHLVFDIERPNHENFSLAVKGSTNIEQGAWYHMAVTKTGLTLRLFVNGKLDGRREISPEDHIENVGTKLAIGTSWGASDPEPDYFLDGQMDELRISNIARYTSDFTPPTSPFEPDINTLALWHMDGNLEDSSVNSHPTQKIGNVNFTTSYNPSAETPTPTPQSTTTACGCADITGNDGVVTILDYSLLVAPDCWNKSRVQNSTDWTNNSCSSRDINGDSALTIRDYSCLAAQWQQSCRR